jgi:hypothetical protein
MTQENARLLLAVAALLVGWAAILFIWKRKRFVRWKQATGTVVELIPRASTEGGGDTWEPGIEFKTKDGRNICFNNGVSSNPPVAPVGGTIPVLYDPADPKEAVVDKFFSRHLCEVLMFSLGLIWMITAICYGKFF